LPKFTMLLQTSPANEPGEFVNSLPPIKNPTTPLASGDTVTEPWVMEVPSLDEVNALIQKQIETLTARVAALEAKLKELSPEGISPQSEPPESPKHESAKPAKSEPSEPVKKEDPDKKEAASPEKGASSENTQEDRQLTERKGK
jgi:hypothetical protein